MCLDHESILVSYIVDACILDFLFGKVLVSLKWIYDTSSGSSCAWSQSQQIIVLFQVPIFFLSKVQLRAWCTTNREPFHVLMLL